MLDIKIFIIIFYHEFIEYIYFYKEVDIFLDLIEFIEIKIIKNDFYKENM